MADLTADLPRLGAGDDPVPVGVLLAGWFDAADRVVAEAAARRPVPLFELEAVSS